MTALTLGNASRAWTNAQLYQRFYGGMSDDQHGASAVLVGAVLGAFLASKRRKEPDAVQTVRDWLEKALEEFSKQWPKAKKQARAIQDDLVAQAQGVSKKLHFSSR